jgi:hypothetical protein
MLDCLGYPANQLPLAHLYRPLASYTRAFFRVAEPRTRHIADRQSHQYDEAIPQFQTALQLTIKAYGPEPYPAGMSMFLLGYVHWKNGDLARQRNSWNADTASSARKWHGILRISSS